MPITLKAALLTEKCHDDEYLLSLEKTFNITHEIDIELAIHININMDEHISLRGVYKNETDTQVAIRDYNKDDNHLIPAIVQLITQVEKQKCCKHNWVRPITEDGDEIPDGRAICSLCEATSKKELAPIPNKTLVSMSCSREYVAKNDWGKEYIQGGESGLVLDGKDSYNTAFIEVFPTINGYSTFIRGEGKTMRDAEEEALQKVKRMEACKTHDFERKDRKDGSATCKKCKLFSSTALPPLTTCAICKTPTKKEFKNGHICIDHYYEMDVKEAILEKEERQKALIEKYSYMDRDKSIYQVKWEKEWEFRIIEIMKPEFDKNEFEKQYREILSLINHITYILKSCLYTEGKTLVSKSDCPKEESLDVIENVISTLKNNMSAIKNHIVHKDSIKNASLIPLEYLKR